METNKKEVIKVNESQFKTLIENSIRKVLNEISWDTAMDATKKSDNRVEMLVDAWSDFKETADYLIQALHGLDTKGYNDDDVQHPDTQGPKLSKEIENLLNKINPYITRKQAQLSNLDAHAKQKFSDAFGGRNFDQVSNDIDKKRDDYYFGPDKDEDMDWNTYKQKHLTPDEIKFDKKF